MTNLVSYDPFRELESMLNRYRYSAESNRLSKEHEGILSNSWAPSVDIKEAKDAYVVKAELAGMDENDIDISINDNILTIRGEKKVDEETDEDDTHRSECYYGSFERSFSLPKQVDINNIKASFKKGVL